MKIKVIKEFLYYRRIHKDSLTAHPETNFSSKMRCHYLTLWKRYSSEYRELTREIKIDPVLAQIREVTNSTL